MGLIVALSGGGSAITHKPSTTVSGTSLRKTRGKSGENAELSATGNNRLPAFLIAEAWGCRCAFHDVSDRR